MKKSVLITGCSKGGIGDALAQEFHNKGLRVFATTRDLAKIERLRAMGREVFQLDVTSQESIRCTMSEVQKVTGGKLDFLVNNAGSGFTMRSSGCGPGCCSETIRPNPTFLSWRSPKLLPPGLIVAKGKVINIRSIIGRIAQHYADLLSLLSCLVGVVGGIGADSILESNKGLISRNHLCSDRRMFCEVARVGFWAPNKEMGIQSGEKERFVNTSSATTGPRLIVVPTIFRKEFGSSGIRLVADAVALSLLETYKALLLRRPSGGFC